MLHCWNLPYASRLLPFVCRTLFQLARRNLTLPPSHTEACDFQFDVYDLNKNLSLRLPSCTKVITANVIIFIVVPIIIVNISSFTSFCDAVFIKTSYSVRMLPHPNAIHRDRRQRVWVVARLYLFPVFAVASSRNGMLPDSPLLLCLVLVSPFWSTKAEGDAANPAFTVCLICMLDPFVIVVLSWLLVSSWRGSSHPAACQVASRTAFVGGLS